MIFEIFFDGLADVFWSSSYANPHTNEKKIKQKFLKLFVCICMAGEKTQCVYHARQPFRLWAALQPNILVLLVLLAVIVVFFGPFCLWKLAWSVAFWWSQSPWPALASFHSSHPVFFSRSPMIFWTAIVSRVSLSPCPHSLVPSSLHLLPSVLRFITLELNVKPCRYLLASGLSLKQMHKCHWWGWKCLTHLFSPCSYTSEAWEQSAELTDLGISVW